MNNNRELEIDLRKIFSMLKKKIIYIIAIGLIGAALAGVYTNIFIDTKYTATVKLYANSSSEALISSNGTITANEIDASERLINTYFVVIRSSTYLQKVADSLGNEYTASQIKGMLNCSAITDTIAFQISVTSSNPGEAARIANAIADTCPEEIVRVLRVGGVEVIDRAQKPTSPSYPNNKKNIALGFLIFFAVSLSYFLISELFNTSITTQEDLNREFDIPVLGTIPRLLPVDDVKSDDRASFEEVANKASSGKNNKNGKEKK